MTRPPGWSCTVDELHSSVMEPYKYDADATLYVAMGSLRKDGWPIIVPLGFIYDREYFYITIADGRSSIGRLRRDPRVSLNFQTWEFPPHFLTVTGVAEEIADPDYAISLRISHRYPKSHVADEDTFDKSWLSQGRVVFRIKPLTVVGTPFDQQRDMTRYTPKAHWRGTRGGRAS